MQESSSLSFSRTEKKCRPRDERRLEGVICLAKWEESHLEGGKWKETTKLSATLLSRILQRGSFERLVAMRSETGETSAFFCEEATSTY